MSSPLPYVLIGTPVAGAFVTHDYTQSVLRLVRHFTELGWASELITQPDGLVTRSRNAFASVVARNEKYTHLLMLDADVTVSPQGIERLIRSGHDVAGCVVPFRKVHWEKVSMLTSEVPDASEEELASFANAYAYWPERGAKAVDGFIPTHAIGSAIMLISRAALLKIAASDLVVEARDGIPAADGIGSGWTFFDPYVDEDGVYLSEDYALCDRWRKLGGTVWADLETTTQHVGPVVVDGNIAASIRAAKRLQAARREARATESA